MSCWVCDKANGTCEHKNGNVLTPELALEIERAESASLRERLAWMTAYAEEQHAHAEGLKATYGTREIRELNAALRTAEALALANGAEVERCRGLANEAGDAALEAHGRAYAAGERASRAEAEVAKLRVDMEEMVEAAGRHTELDARLERIANGLAIDAAVVARAERAEAKMDELQRRLDAALTPYDPATAHALAAVRAERDELRGLLGAACEAVPSDHPAVYIPDCPGWRCRSLRLLVGPHATHPAFRPMSESSASPAAIPEGTPGEGTGRP